ncbi:MAG: MtnX-like HAD-IB family phosphatase [Chloroflexota bacterium]
MKTLVQCDFDGTITEKDVSFLLLDAFADGNWRQMLTQYREGQISVNYFNTRAFAMIKADKQTLIDFMKPLVRIRPGFHELLAYCRRQNFRFVIVSNGQDFYIDEILAGLGEKDMEIFAARTEFDGHVKAQYIGPDGRPLQDGFKEAYTRLFIEQGYRIIYIGNGLSDVPPARLSHRIFATDEMLDCLKKTDLSYEPFNNLNDVTASLKSSE